MSKEKKGLGRNFLLLFQGQFVSGVGDALYNIALGFYVLDLTGSTALMGSLMAVGILPGVLFGPFAGAIADRMDRKKIIIWMDVAHGLAILAVAAAAYLGVLSLWHLFAAAVVMGLSSSLFVPAVNGMIPDIVESDKLMRANSMIGYSDSLKDLVGGPIGGMLYTAIGAPLLFLLNGVSFLLSAFSEKFIVAVHQMSFAEDGKSRWKILLQDCREGFRYMLRSRGIGSFLIFCLLANFFGTVMIFLLLPYFQQSAHLGPAYYGLAVAMMAAGSGAGMLFTTFVNIREQHRTVVFGLTWVLTSVCFSLMLHFDIAVMFVLLVIGSAGMAVFNVLFRTAFHQGTPSYMRGKVYSIIGMGMNGLMPVSYLLGGLLAQYYPILWIVPICGAVNIVLLAFFIFRKPFGDFLAARCGAQPQEVSASGQPS